MVRSSASSVAVRRRLDLEIDDLNCPVVGDHRVDSHEVDEKASRDEHPYARAGDESSARSVTMCAATDAARSFGVIASSSVTVISRRLAST